MNYLFVNTKSIQVMHNLSNPYCFLISFITSNHLSAFIFLKFIAYFKPFRFSEPKMSSRITKFTSKFHFTTFVRTLSSTVTAKNADSSVPRPKPLPQASLEAEHIYTSQHVELRESYSKLIQKEIEPYIDEWEAKGKMDYNNRKKFKLGGKIRL